MIGSKLAHYEVIGKLGAGGMGEVYEATDSKLGRSVAIKVLPEAFTHDSDRVARLQREARVLASLNHPNIAAIYGLELEGGQNFLVMELVPGETLAERIRRGPIPAGEALGIAVQIASALEAAHEKGVIHRDLKPANVKVTPDGVVKVLDFGLAKAFETDSGTANVSNSPTLSMAATQQGVVLGTAAYMSPEQAKGRIVDPRTDIFAFGALLFEMLTGRPAFEGDDVADILGAVLRTDPDWTLLPPQLAPMISRLLRLCLQKDAKKRRQTATDVRLDLEEAKTMPIAAPVPAAAEPGVPLVPPTRRLRWIATGVLGLVLGSSIVLGLWSPWRTSEPKTAVRLSVELGMDASLATGSTLALSPNGSLLVFAGIKNGERQLYLRRLDQLLSTPIAGTTGAIDPIFSPDSQWVAFVANGKLKKIAITGGASVELADAPNFRGGSWGDDDYIVFSPNNTSGTTLMRVPAAGGKAEALTKLGEGEVVHRWPQVLPGARAVLYTAHRATNGYDEANIVVQPLPTGTPKIVQRGGYHARYLPSGHLVYIHAGTLFAATFDLSRLEMTGPPVPVVQGVISDPGIGRSQFAVSVTGALVYAAGDNGGSDTPVLWMSRDGKTTSLRNAPANWSNPRFSPDGRKLAMDIFNGSIDVYVYEWTRDTMRRFTLDNMADDRKPVWTADGQRITFSSTRDNKVANLYWQKADGTGEIQRLTESKNVQWAGSWHPTGRFLAFAEQSPQSQSDLMILPMGGDEKSGWKPGQPTVFLNKPSVEGYPMFSPDGHWIAYQSDESGRPEVFVRPFPGPGGYWQISTAGGTTPAWSQSHHELLYVAPDRRVMFASYAVVGDSFNADKPKLWSERALELLPRNTSFDLHPDGERVAVSVLPEGPATAPRDKVTFIFNFFDELRRVALPKK